MAASFNGDGVRKAIERLAKAKRKTTRAVCTSAAKGFLKKIIAFTPPGSKDVTGTAAKKQGEAAITGDVSRIFKTQTSASLAALEAMTGGEYESAYGHKGAAPIGRVRAKIIRTLRDALFWHQKRRVKSTGRTLNVNRDVTTGHRRRDLLGLDVGLLTRELFNSLLTELKKRVGTLAAGWAEACVKYRVAMPAWIKRHGTRSGLATEQSTSTSFRITVGNQVPFIGTVRDLDRRVEKAVEYQQNAMNREADFLLKRDVKAAGF